MVPHKIIAVVEDVDAARYALRWAVQNLLRNGDLVTLIHVYPSSRSKSKKRQRRLRLKGFQLALSFKDLCVGVPEVKVEIIVTEGDLGTMIISMVKEIGASALILGLHDQSFLYKSATVNTNMNSLNCRILAVKQPSTDTTTRTRDTSTNVVLSQIEIVRLWYLQNSISPYISVLQLFTTSFSNHSLSIQCTRAQKLFSHMPQQLMDDLFQIKKEKRGHMKKDTSSIHYIG